MYVDHFNADRLRHLADAPAHMTVTVYPELVEEKGVALLRGDIVTEAIINPQEVGRNHRSRPC